MESVMRNPTVGVIESGASGDFPLLFFFLFLIFFPSQPRPWESGGEKEQEND
jgi:hypothetical protein